MGFVRILQTWCVDESISGTNETEKESETGAESQ